MDVLIILILVIILLYNVYVFPIIMLYTLNII